MNPVSSDDSRVIARHSAARLRLLADAMIAYRTTMRTCVPQDCMEAMGPRNTANSHWCCGIPLIPTEFE